MMLIKNNPVLIKSFSTSVYYIYFSFSVNDVDELTDEQLHNIGIIESVLETVIPQLVSVMYI